MQQRLGYPEFESLIWVHKDWGPILIAQMQKNSAKWNIDQRVNQSHRWSHIDRDVYSQVQLLIPKLTLHCLLFATCAPKCHTDGQSQY